MTSLIGRHLQEFFINIIKYLHFKKKVHKWIKELRTFANPDIAIIIVGNKSDLENIRQVDNNLAEEYANKVGAKHFKGSAKSGAGIQEIFKTLVKGIF